MDENTEEVMTFYHYCEMFDELNGSPEMLKQLQSNHENSWDNTCDDIIAEILKQVGSSIRFYSITI